MYILGILAYTLSMGLLGIGGLLIIAHILKGKEETQLNGIANKINKISNKYLHGDKFKNKFNLKDDLVANGIILIIIGLIFSMIGQFCYRMYYAHLISETTKQQMEIQKEILKTVKNANNQAEQLQKGIQSQGIQKSINQELGK